MTSIRDDASRAFYVLLLLAVLTMTACGIGSSGGESKDDKSDVEATEIDFSVTSVVATPSALLQVELATTDIVIDATINNTGNTDSGSFEVRADLHTGTECDGGSFLLGARMMSVAAGSSTAFRVSTVPGNVLGLGTFYLCIQIDATDRVDELDEANNTIGGTRYPVVVANCFSDAACDDSNPCTDDTCRANAGCQHIANSAPCDDGLFCTVNDTCAGGACQRGERRQCSDADLCDGTEYCDEVVGACRNGPVANACDDGNACNGTETCNPVDGACFSGTPIQCDVVINNGLAPPAASNVIDNDLYSAESSQSVLLRDFGCPTFGDPNAACPVAGTPTRLRVENRSDVGDLEVFDTSVLEVTGGLIDKLVSGRDAMVTISGGSVEFFEAFGAASVSGGSHGLLRLHGQSSVTGGVVESLELDPDFVSPGAELRGGVVTTLYSGTGSAVRGGRVSLLCALGDPGVIYGTGFDQNAGIFGPLSRATGFLSGTLELGDPLNATYHQMGSWCYHPTEGTFDTAGFFTLLPPPSTFIANGRAGGSAENTLDASDLATRYHDIFVRNANCPDAWPTAHRDDPCTAPGPGTEVDVASGAVIPGTITVLDQSTVVIRGGQVSSLRTGASARIEIWGENFTVDGTPVAFGEIANVSGVLAGTLLSDEPLSANFDREDPAAPSSLGIIVLRPVAELEGGV